jgi:hypothetical protein
MLFTTQVAHHLAHNLRPHQWEGVRFMWTNIVDDYLLAEAEVGDEVMGDKNKRVHCFPTFGLGPVPMAHKCIGASPG